MHKQSAVQGFRDFAKVTALTESIGASSKEQWGQSNKMTAFESVTGADGRADWSKMATVKCASMLESFEARFASPDRELSDDDKTGIQNELFSYLKGEADKGKDIVNLEQLRETFPTLIKLNSRYANTDTTKVSEYVDSLIRQSPEESAKADLKEQGIDFGAQAEFPGQDNASGVVAEVGGDFPTDFINNDVKTDAPVITAVSVEGVPAETTQEIAPVTDDVVAPSDDSKSFDSEINGLNSDLDSLSATPAFEKVPEGDKGAEDATEKTEATPAVGEEPVGTAGEPKDEEEVQDAKKFLESLEQKKGYLHQIRAQFESTAKKSHKTAVLESIKKSVLGNVGTKADAPGTKPKIEKGSVGVTSEPEGEKKAKAGVKAAQAKAGNLAGKLETDLGKLSAKKAKLESIIDGIRSEKAIEAKLESIKSKMFESIGKVSTKEESPVSRVQAAFESVQAIINK